jgi:hypothetical protein
MGISPAELLFGNAVKLDRGLFFPPAERNASVLTKPLSESAAKLLFLQDQLISIAADRLKITDSQRLGNCIKMSKKTFIRLVKEKTFESGDEKPVEMDQTYEDKSYFTPMKENPMKSPIFTTPPQNTPKKAYLALLKPIEISDPAESVLEKLKNLKKIQLQIRLEKYLFGKVAKMYIACILYQIKGESCEE